MCVFRNSMISGVPISPRWNYFPLMMSFWECASSWLASNHYATRAFEPLEFPDRLQRPTCRHLTPVFTRSSWLFTASVFLRSGSCGTSCTTPTWAATTGPARRPGPLSGRGVLEQQREERRNTVRRRCFSRISDATGPNGISKSSSWYQMAKKHGQLESLWSVQKHSWVIWGLLQVGRSSLGKWIGKACCASVLFQPGSPKWI